MNAPRHRHQFSLRELMQSVACFAIAFGAVAFPARLGIAVAETRLFFGYYCYWIAGMAVGAGIGSLLGRFNEGLVSGGILMFVVFLVIMTVGC